ncbi:DUF2064 domain-containing protein [Sporichthya brevicatena]|uniref:DUF2064 domain-containing protein n=1 Tax=Sporichthya brevicatena TaxID=171442 RepID=A0ABN1G9U0_9ACTN
MTNLLVVAKSPVPGRVKTRLCPPFTPAEAAALAEAALRDTLDLVVAAPATRRVLALEGEPGPWLPAGIEVRPQRGAGLDERIANALADLTGPTLLVGMDTPQLTMRHLTVDFANHDAWFGPAADGGFWGLGLRGPDPALVLGVPMSRDDTGAVQLARLRSAGLRVGLLPVLRDVDTAADAGAVAAECAATGAGRRFATAYDALSAALTVPAGARVG